jgi:hypothetical protein
MMPVVPLQPLWEVFSVSTKRFSARREGARRAWSVLALAVLLLPVVVFGAVIKLKDGSTLRGKLVRVDGDSLSVKLSIGSTVRLHRSLVESIEFTDSIVAPPPVSTQPTSTTPKGVGTISVVFEDRNVSSKITIEKKKDWDAHVRSNDIIVELVVDGLVAYSAVDSTTDKTIYKGHEKQLKNDAELADFTVQVPAGPHRCSVVVRNRDPDTFRDDFEPSPLGAVLDLGEITVAPGGFARVDVRIDKGLLRMSSPRLYRSDDKKDD